MKRSWIVVRGVALTFLAAATGITVGAAESMPPRPNILVILADDLGFSDLGCYGGEIDTPNLDRLAAGGLRFTQGYNTARCWPTRAALLTGYYAQAIGRDKLPGGTGGAQSKRPGWAKLLPEMLAPAGYRSYHSGKWHIDGNPKTSGFDRSLDVAGAGQSNYFDATGIKSDEKPVDQEGFYNTTAIGDHAVACLADHARDHAGTPFFQYVAFIAPHFPLQAPAEAINKYRERYRAGWDTIRAERIKRIAAQGIVTTEPSAIEREVGPPYHFKEIAEKLGPSETNRPLAWDSLTEEQKEFQATKMAIHAAMVDIMDREIGRIIQQLADMGALDNTLILFASDNGASAEMMIRGEGHDPLASPGSRKTFLCLGPGWSSCANAPLRRHKTWVHEGGIATPWIVHWPAGVAAKGELRHQPVHVIDAVPTVLEVARIKGEQGQAAPPIHGKSFAAALRTADAPAAHDSLWWCHEENRAVRMGDWKLVASKGEPWELYDLASDRCETKDLAAANPERVARLEREWNRVAEECRGMAPAEQPRAKPRKKASARKPNLVFFLCDDLGSGDIMALGGKDIQTPNIDALVARGTKLSWHWAGSAVCAPSRCVLMTGKHPGHAAVRSNREVEPEGQFPMPEGTVTLARILRDAGYATGGFGKWGLGAPGSESDPVACGFDKFFGYNCQREAHSYYPDHLWDNRERIAIDQSLSKDHRYSADLIAEKQLAFIREHADEPFFLYVPTTVPHLALEVPANEPSLAGYEKHFGDEEPYRGGKGYVPCERPLATYAAMVTRMDREVGRIIRQLAEMKVLDDTIFVFSSDNGAASPGSGGVDTERFKSHGSYRGWKGSPYEGGLRVPAVIAWPGHIPEGKSLDMPTGFEDWMPTLLDLAGLADRTPKDVDGGSLADALLGGPACADRSLYRELTQGQWQTFTDGRWKAIRKGTSARKQATTVSTELYDLAADPAETTDVAHKHPDVVARLEAAMNREHVPDANWPMPFADEASKRQQEKPSPNVAAAVTPPIALATAALMAPSDPKPAKRPNILFILVDDQSPYDLKTYDPSSRLDTPVLDSLAARGCVLDAAYHMGSFSGAVCVPSRHMIMTGRSVWHLPIGPGQAKGKNADATFQIRCPPDIEDYVLAEVFNKAGYATMRTCKEGNSYEGANRKFTVRHDATKREGTAEGGSAWHAERVLDFLSDRANSGDEKPFLIEYGFSHPHDTRDGTPELLAKYGAVNHADKSTLPSLDPRQPPLPVNWLPRHPFDNTEMNVRDEVAASGVWRRRDEATIRNEIGREFACSENIDIQIGRVLDKLRDMGELENTWIFYTSDHGIAIGRHGLQGKQNLYEHTWRVPFIVAGPGVQPGSRAPGNIYLGDVLATVCDVAGIKAPKTNEGKSFLPVLTGKIPQIRDVLYGVYSGGAKPGIRSVRQGDWKLIKYESPKGGMVTQLFNLKDNPDELLAEHHDPAVTAVSQGKPAPEQKNLADDPAHATKRAEMEALLLSEMKRHDDPYRFSDQPAAKRKS